MHGALRWTRRSAVQRVRLWTWGRGFSELGADGETRELDAVSPVLWQLSEPTEFDQLEKMIFDIFVSFDDKNRIEG